MRKLTITLSLLALLLLVVISSGCEKIRLNRLEGSWELKSWKLVSTDGSEVNGTNLVPELAGSDNILVEFSHEGEATLVVFEEDSAIYGDVGYFDNNNTVTEITFSDTISFFNPNITYKVDKLSLKYLELHGPFTLNGTLYPKSTLKFENAN